MWVILEEGMPSSKNQLAKHFASQFLCVKLSTVSDEAQTRPTIETVLERINALSSELRSEMRAAREYLDKRFEELEIRLDRIESDVNKTRSEMLTLRADFREFRAQFKQPA
jgi:chromosome segregation ATPase